MTNVLDCPEEIIVEILRRMSRYKLYQEILLFESTCKHVRTVWQTWKRDILGLGRDSANISYVVWLHTKKTHVAAFNKGIGEIYELDVVDVIQQTLNNIPNIYNGLYYDANTAVNKVYELSKFVRERMYVKTLIATLYDITPINIELQLLIVWCTSFIIELVEYKTKTYYGIVDVGDMIATQTQLVNSVQVDRFKEMFVQLAVLNTALCHVAKLINDEQ